MFRADSGPNDTAMAVPALRGLDTTSSPHRVAPDASPDLLNVVLERGTVAKRGGFVPTIRQTPRVCSLRNRGYVAIGRSDPTSSVNTTYRTVVGAAYAGHRPCWDDAEILNGITIDFFCQIDDLTTSHGGNGAPSGATPFGPSPYTVKVRPILSKGPIKRFADTAQLGAAHATNSIAWQAAVAAIPFAVYLFNNGGTWEFRMSFHYREGGNWQIRTLSTNAAGLGGVRINTTYQITCGYDIAANSCFLRVGAWFDTASPNYVSVSGSVGSGAQTAIPSLTKAPIQVFDCPQAFIEQSATPHPTVPPGLGLGGSTDGGYWFASLRFEGSIEDIVIYRGLVPNAASGSLDRSSRINPSSPPAERLQHWPVDGSTNVVEEISGVGNHLHITPSEPSFDTISGGMGGSLAFDGATGYALIETSDIGKYSWRTKSDGSTKATMWGALSHRWGIEVAFWPESIEPNFEQVIAELHGVCRLVITTGGFLRVYVRNDVIVNNAPMYQTAVTSTRPIVPGQRYHVIAMIDATVPSVDLVINGRRDSSPTLPSNNSAWVISGVTLGMGMFRCTAITDTGDPRPFTAGSDQINTDSRSAFFGRIENFRILLGEYPFDTPHAGLASEVPSQYKGYHESDYTAPLHKHMQVPASFLGTRNDVTPWLDDEDPLSNASTGMAIVSHPLRASSGELHTSLLTTAAASLYTVGKIPGRQQEGVYHIYSQVGVRKVLAAYDFSEPVTAPEIGAYSQSVECVPSNSTTIVQNGEKLIAIRRPYVPDLADVMGHVQLRCAESDTMKEFEGAATWNYPWQRRYKPYLTRSPSDLAPRWSEGMLRPNLGENPIAMIAGWTEETTGDVLTFAISRRSLYWVKRPYRLGSPFRGEPAAEALWFFGARNDACRAAGMAAHGSGTTWTSHLAVVDLWVRPTRLDGKRMLLCYGDNIGFTVRYLLWLDHGTIYVAGDNTSGGWWCYFHGGLNGSALLRETSIALNVWSHIQVSIGNSAVSARINGQIITMTSHPSAASIVSGAIPSATNLWIGGMDADQMVISRSASQDFQFLLQPFHGLMTDLRERDTLDTTYWDAGESGVAPQARAVNDGNTRWLFRADSDTGWAIASSTPGVPSLEVRIRELIGIRHDLDDAERTALSAVVFRNELIFTQKNGYPHRVSFTSLDDPLGPFRCVRLGMDAPIAILESAMANGFVSMNPDDTTSGSPYPFVVDDVRYEAYVSFVSSNGEESEAERVGACAAPTTPSGVIHLWDLPRSADPQVVSRNIYLSVNGATPLFVGSVLDNETRFYEIRNKGVSIAAPTDGSNLPAPIARKVVVGSGVLVLTTLDGNGNSFAVSGLAPGYFPLSRMIVVDSENGEPVLGAISYLNTTYLFKRDGTWAFTLAGVQDAAFSAGLRLVNSSSSAAGGTVIYDNVIYGASDRGVFRFDGSNYVYISRALEGDLGDVRLDTPGLLAQQGAFLASEGQYWLSVRLIGETANRRVYILDADDGMEWTRCLVPEHVVLTRLPTENRARIVLGTIHGEILHYDPLSTVDGIRDVDHHNGSQAIQGSIGGSTSTTLTIASGSLDVAYDGLRGRVLQFIGSDGIVLATRTIVTNTSTTIVWDQAYTVPSGATYAIGGITAYWSTPWLGSSRMGSFVRSEFIDLEFEPVIGTLRVEHLGAMTLASERSFDWSSATRQTIDMSKGYLDKAVYTKENRHGRYLRVAFGTSGVRSPFRVTGYGFRFGEAGLGGRPR